MNELRLIKSNKTDYIIWLARRPHLPWKGKISNHHCMSKIHTQATMMRQCNEWRLCQSLCDDSLAPIGVHSSHILTQEHRLILYEVSDTTMIWKFGQCFLCDAIMCANLFKIYSPPKTRKLANLPLLADLNLFHKIFWNLLLFFQLWIIYTHMLVTRKISDGLMVIREKSSVSKKQAS